MTEMERVAVLLTCHNRRDKTSACLRALFNANLPAGFTLSVFLVDDGSTDGTSETINTKFAQVNIIKGSGELFWNKGMRLAWQTAAQTNGFEFYLWLNDDTLIENNALSELLDCAQEASEKACTPVIITGACRASENTLTFSYGGRTDAGAMIPNGKLQYCKYINGNVVLIPKAVFEKLGYLSPEYTHSMGDFDYGLRAIKAGFNCYTTKSYIATCPPNGGIPAWCNSEVPLKRRWELLHSPNGLNVWEYLNFVSQHHGFIQKVISCIKAYLKTLFPKIYFKIKNI